MFWLIIPYIFASGMVVYGNTIIIKSIGMFIQGALHVKITLCYTHIYELVPDNWKPFCTVFLNFVDSLTLVIAGLVFKYVTRDAVEYYRIAYIV